MGWAKPSMSVAETVTFCEEPAARLRLAVLTEREKFPVLIGDTQLVQIQLKTLTTMTTNQPNMVRVWLRTLTVAMAT